MRIAICGYATISPSTSARGIGRYTLGLIKALIHNCPNDEIVVYLRGTRVDGNPLESFLAQHPNAIVVWVQENPNDKNRTLDAITDNRDRLDWLILTSPHESHVSKKGKIPRVATVVYDMIPARFPAFFLDPPVMANYKRAWEDYIAAARSYDKLLAISESTRSDFIELAEFPPDQVVTVGTGVDPRFKPRSLTWQYPKWLKEVLHERPYVLHVGGMDPRKGGEVLMLAWASLPHRIKSMHRLVYAYEIDGTYSFHMRQLASLNGLNFQFELLGYVTEDRLLDLYQNARVMCLPSRAEGLGLPLIESLACGVPVIAGNNTGQPEAVGEGGILVDPLNGGQIAGALTNLLDDTDMRDRMARRGLDHAQAFNWEAVATRTRDCLAKETVSPTGSPGSRRAQAGAPLVEPGDDTRVPLAFFGIVPPTMSGVAPIGITLAQALAKHYKVTFYHDPAVKPQAKGGWAKPFAWLLPADAYDGCERRVFQFGNSEHHAWQIPLIQRRGGIVTLHDVCLEGIWGWLKEHRDYPGDGDWTSLLLSFDPANTVFVVHSKTAIDMLMSALSLSKSHARFGMIPPPAPINVKTGDERQTIRKRLGLPDAQGVVLAGCGGIVHISKLPHVVVSAFRLAQSRCQQHGIVLHLAMIGMEGDGGVTRNMCSQWGVPDIHWIGKLEYQEFADAMASCDIAVQLRQPPTNGETSGALLDAMRGGVPAIASDIGSFADYPDDTLVKVKPSPFNTTNVADLMARLAIDEDARIAIRREAIEHIHKYNDPDTVAEQYGRVIEQAIARRREAQA